MMPVHDCSSCDGRGGVLVEEPGEPTTCWRCEDCGHSGQTTSCRECADPMSLPEAEESGYRCALCLDAEDRHEREASIQRRMG